MASKSTHKLELIGVNKTGGAFSGVANAAASAGLKISSVFGGALAAAAGYLSFRAIKGGIDELGHLTDIAMKTGTTVKDLTSAVQIMNVLGIQNMGIDQLGKAFDYMRKATGRSGMAGFEQTIAELAGVKDEALQAQLAVKYFGRSGMELLPLVAGAARNGIEPFRQLREIFIGVDNDAANSGDQVSDALGTAAWRLKNIWLNVIGKICSKFGDGAMEGALNFCAWIEFAVSNSLDMIKVLWERLYSFIPNLGEAAGTWYTEFLFGVFDKLSGDKKLTWGEVFGNAGAAWSREREMQAELLDNTDAMDRIKKNAEKLQSVLDKNKNVNELMDKAAGAPGGRGGEDAAKVAEKMSKNAMVLAGSNAATKMISGINVEQEQTVLLRQIAQNTEREAEKPGIEDIEEAN